MDTRFYNGRICTFQNGAELFDGEVWVQGGRIAYAGPPKAADGTRFGRQIDLDRNLLLPGFKNAHTHSAMTFLRSYADDLPLLDWLEKQVFPMEAKLQPQHVYWLSRLAILEYLTSGITANFDMYMPIGADIDASVDSGFRTVLCSPLNNFYSSVAQQEEDWLRYNAYHKLISVQFGFHAEYTCAPELLRELAALLAKHQKPVFTHSSESAREVKECLQRTDMTPTAYMESLGLFEYGGGCYHCVHMTDDDLSIMKKHNMAVISCPGSNTKLASGIARLCDMQEKGITLALGTDGPASNNALDFFREMFLATGLQKLARDDAGALPALDVLAMACHSGARVMGLEDCDSLAQGKCADLVVIDLKQPNMQPENHILKNLVYSGSKQNVKLTMVNGKILYEDGRFDVGEDVATIYQKANEIIDSMR